MFSKVYGHPEKEEMLQLKQVRRVLDAGISLCDNSKKPLSLIEAPTIAALNFRNFPFEAAEEVESFTTRDHRLRGLVKRHHRVSRSTCGESAKHTLQERLLVMQANIMLSRQFVALLDRW